MPSEWSVGVRPPPPPAPPQAPAIPHLILGSLRYTLEFDLLIAIPLVPNAEPLILNPEP